MNCPACGAAVPEGARFCPSCGQLLQARTDERRIVTVLFADLVGFTTLSEARDPEHVKNMVDQCFERLVTDVTAFGGQVDKILGDAIIALFGAPVAHEDDAERAVRTALQMQKTLGAMSSETSGGGALRLRIGVNTGEVLVGALRAGGDYTAMGDVVNVASRLQTLASPGEVVVGPATFAATRDVVRYESLGAVQARGREELVDAWRAIDALAPPGYRPRRVTTPLIGRDAELGILRHTLDAAVRRNRAHLVLLLGEAGIGKSRLAEEMATLAAGDRGALVLEGRCVPYGEANVWWPIAESLRQACGIESADPADVSRAKCRSVVRQATRLPQDDPDIDRYTEGLLYLMGHEDALADVDPARAAEDARRSLLNVLEAIARHQAVVVILSELHWADQLVLDLIDTVLDRLRNLPVVLVGTARPELEGRWMAKAGRHNVVVLNLDPLDDAATEELLATLLGGPAPPELRSALIERSGGNPFFLEELVALLHEAPTKELPATLRGLVAARLDALPPRDRLVLEDAAVLGRSGPAEAVATLAQARSETDVDRALEALAAKDLLSLSEGEFEFRSELVREVAYETLTKAERARRHASVGEWLGSTARRTDREDEYLEQLAHHYGAAAGIVQELGSLAGVPDNIMDLAHEAIERAAARARQRDMHPVVIRLMDRAERLVPAHKVDLRRKVLLERADAKAKLHDLIGARQDLQSAIAQLDKDTHPRAWARALTVRGQIEQHEGDMKASAATLDDAVAAWRAVGDEPAAAEALSRRGMTSLFSGDAEAAEAALREALATFREQGSTRNEAWALWNLAWSAFTNGNLSSAEERLDKAAAAFTAAGDWGGLAWVRGLLGYVRFFQGRRQEAAELAERLLEHEKDEGDRWATGMMLVLLAAVRMWEGHTADALEPARQALRLFQSLGDAQGLGMSRGYLSRVLAALGRVDEAYAVLDDEESHMAITATAMHLGDSGVLRELVGLGEVDVGLAGDMGRSEGTALVGWALLQNGQAEAALRHFEDAVANAVADGPLAGALTALATGRVALGDASGALHAADQVPALSVRTYLDVAGSALARGFALAQQGRTEEAEAAFDEAVATVDTTGDRAMQLITRLGRAMGLTALGSPAAADARDDAEARRAEVGISAEGWQTVFSMAANSVPSSLER